MDPGPDDLLACAFTRLCRRNSANYNTDFASDRAFREICTTPIFKSPKVLMILVKQDSPQSNGGVLQGWFPWQVCTNCLAGRAIVRCTLWRNALDIQTPWEVRLVMPGQSGDLDQSYGWFTGNRDALLAKDVGYFDMWLCRDGQLRTMVSLGLQHLLFKNFANLLNRRMCRAIAGQGRGVHTAGGRWYTTELRKYHRML
jgi:hypothetical protein